MIGLYVSIRIWKEKNSHTPMVCPLDGECETVLQSKYSKFAGVGLEYAGGLYYGLLLIGYGYLIYNFISPIATILFLITSFGFLFSIYLTAIQKFVLKKWCTWCLSSALVTTLLFLISGINILTSQSLSLVFTDLLFYINTIIGLGLLVVLIKSVGIIIGFSSAFITDIMTLKFLKDFKIDEKEDRNLLILSHITWISIGLIIISFVANSFIKIDFINEATMGASLIILSVIVLNEILFRAIIIPRLIGYRLYSNVFNVTKIVFLRKVAFTLNIISVVSWIFLLGILLLGINGGLFMAGNIIGDYILTSSILVVGFHSLLLLVENNYKQA